MRKKSGKRAARRFDAEITEVERFLTDVTSATLDKRSLSWAHEVALLKLTVALERVMLECLVAAINNSTGPLSARTQVKFPKHITNEVAEYLVVGSSYFDFRGSRDGLIKKIREFVDESHWLVTAVKTTDKPTLDKLFAIRNWAAHESKTAKRRAIALVGPGAGSPGSWLKKGGRTAAFIRELRDLANEIESAAPF
ncbi:hypothetical protein [Agromyces sp. NPDC060279]|uniref:hypothetical protein n=1 Tax=Agromyces sp. NPDC060279 TaxID=3347092 RepID=UPI00365F9FF9